MHPLSRRRIAAIATTALVAGGGLTSTVQAADTPPDAPARLLGGIVDPLPGDVVGALPSLLDNVLTQTTAELQATLSTLTPAEVGDLLVAASPDQLTKLLDASTAGQLSAALATLTPTEAGDLLADADPTQLDALLAGLTSGALSDALAALAPADLTEIVGGLTPARISELVAAGAGASLIDGLLGTATALAGGSPGAPAVDGLLAQVGALLGGGLPTDAGQLTDLGTLLTTVRALLATSGLDTSVLSGLLTTANRILASSPAGPATAPLREVVTQITLLVAPAGGTVPGGTTPGGGTTGGGTTARPPAAATAAAPRFTAYRATIRSVKLTKKRTSASFELRCPAIAPKGCLVQVSAKVAGRRAARPQLLALVKGTSAPVTVKLTRSAARRLRAKGGSLRLSAQTALSSLPTVTKTVKVKRPRKRR